MTKTSNSSGIWHSDYGMRYLEAVPKRDERYGRAEIAVCRWLVSEWQEAACEEGQFVLRSVRLALEPWEATPGKARA